MDKKITITLDSDAIKALTKMVINDMDMKDRQTLNYLHHVMANKAGIVDDFGMLKGESDWAAKIHKIVSGGKSFDDALAAIDKPDTISAYSDGDAYQVYQDWLYHKNV